MKFTTASEVDLGHEKVGKLLFMLAVPAILSQIVNLLYNVHQELVYIWVSKIILLPKKSWVTVLSH